MHRETLAKLPVELVDRLDRLAGESNVPRSALIRSAVERCISESTDGDIDRKIIAGYTAQPQSDTWAMDPFGR